MPHNLLLLLVTVLFIAGCRTVQIRHFDTSLSNTRRLPALEAVWKPANLEVIHYSTLDSAQIASRYPYAPVYPVAFYPPIPSVAVHDARTLFEREVIKSITDPFMPKRGYITCQVVSAIARPRGMGMAYLSLGMLGIPYLLGAPQGKYKTELLVEVQVLDSNHQLVGLYSAYGRESIPIALYWGYRYDDAKRLSNINAFRSALYTINQQMQADYDRLTIQLTKP